MGIAYAHVGRNLTVTVWHREVTADEWRDQVERLGAELREQPRRLFLTDIRSATVVSTIDDEQIVEMADSFARDVAGVSDVRVALVAGSLFEGATTFEVETTADGIRTFVFADPEIACVWLGAATDEVLPAVSKLRQSLT